jgi:phosphoribosylpyrophosphate synthetase
LSVKADRVLCFQRHWNGSAGRFWPVLRVVSLAPLLAAAIRHLWTGESLAELYERRIAGTASEPAGC